jgi:signal transduction histidine kinase
MRRQEFITLPAGKTPDEDQFLLAGKPADRQEYRRAFTVIGVLFVASAVVAPFASVQLPAVGASIPVFGTGILMTDLITAALLFAQFSIVRWRALLVLASGYCFTALIVVPHALTFPGAFAPASVIGGGVQTTPWLYVVWHAAVPLAVIFYALLKDGNSESRLAQGSAGAAIALSVAAVVASALGITWFTTVHHEFLPTILLVSPVRLSVFGQAMFVAVIFLGAVAVALLWTRHRSVLDLWLMVMVSVLVLEIVLNGVFSTVRFSIGFYAGRLYSFLTGAIVLVVLLSETTTLYPQLARSLKMQRHEREGRHLSMDATAASIAHEVSQPLAAIVANGNAAIQWLSKKPPNLEEALAGLRNIVRDGSRAGEIIASIRAMFNKGPAEKVTLDSNEVIREAIALFQGELQNGQVSVRTGLMEGLPRVVADKIQLQQVILNLVANAVDAMRSVSDRTRVLHVTTELHRSNGVLITVEDCGLGIAPSDIDRIFEPFFTTKPTGMGVGLSICRSIIEAHGGRLTASACQPHGSAFRIVLPAQEALAREA